MERSRTRNKAKTQLVSLDMVWQVLRGKLNISVRRRGSVVELHNLSRICGDRWLRRDFTFSFDLKNLSIYTDVTEE